MDRTNESGDWLRREIETAISEKRNIIPIFFDGFNFGAQSVSEKLSGKLGRLKKYNGLEVPAGYFNEAMERLRDRYLKVTLDAVLHPVSDEVQKIVNEQQVAANRAISSKGEHAHIAAEREAQNEHAGRILQNAEKKREKETEKWPDKLNIGKTEFLCIPKGKFTMGDGSEKHEVDIPYDYFMSRFPVTNEMFEKFVEASNFRREWDVSKWREKLDHPVVYASWLTALEYCVWLKKMYSVELSADYIFRLPTESEWEKAARGTDERAWPWGNEFDRNKCGSEDNIWIGLIKVLGSGTTPVGKYSPQGDSPYGIADMASNVWEWTHSLYRAYPYRTGDGRESNDAGGARVLRGGSFYDLASGVRTVSRRHLDPGDYHDDTGFRVVLAPNLS